MKKPEVVVIGGGTGTFTVLSGLKKYPLDLSAIVTMADDGGSTGILRDELGVLPPGDVRQCLVALSGSSYFLRRLMNYRFLEGGLKGHSFGNLFLSALEKMSGSFDRAVETASEILRIEGRVIPSTLKRVRLMADLANGRTLRGEREFEDVDLRGMKRMYLAPRAAANPKAIAAIKSADTIVIGPGNLYQSLIPNLLVAGIPEAVSKSRAIKVYNCNLMTKDGHTNSFSVNDYVATVERYLGGPFDYVIFNNKKPTARVLKRYAYKGERFVEPAEPLPGRRYIGADLVSRQRVKPAKSDPLSARHALIRHDPHRLAKLIFGIVWQETL